MVTKMIILILFPLLACLLTSSHVSATEVLRQIEEEGFVDPLEKAGMFEGDIAGVTISDIFSKNAVRDRRRLWSNGIVPYVISSSFSSREKDVILMAMRDYHLNSCIKFVERNSQPDYIYLMKGYGCSSNVGRVGGGQEVSLDTDCVHKGIIIHELMHAVGFWHEQSRGDRNKHVKVLWGNIKSGMKHNFLKYNWNEIQSLEVPYDTDSVMHYGQYSFSKSHRLPTIVPKIKGVHLGQREGFSKADIKKLNLLYKCRTHSFESSSNNV